MKTHEVSLWEKIKTPILPLVLGGVFLLLLWWNRYTRTQTIDTSLSISEYYACDKTATLPCINPSSWNTLIWNNMYTISDDTLVFSPQQHSRSLFVRQLINQWFTWFVTIPYPSSGNNALISSGIWNIYTVSTIITWTDMLDTYLEDIQKKNTFSGKQIFTIPKSEWWNRTGIYLFKNTGDLSDIGYQVISHRSRHNTDKEYRRYNISKSFELFHHVQIILPGETFTFLDAAQYDEYEQKNYKIWYVIVDWKEIKEYGGGICGASTAIYQWILTNRSLERTHLRPHTKRFSSLYPATINGEYITTPGIDSAIYAGQIDLHFRNISKHPTILVANYDGDYNGEEQVFSLWYSYEQGSFKFLHGGYIRHDEPAKEWTGINSIRWWCYTWDINGEEKRSCYQEVQ